MMFLINAFNYTFTSTSPQLDTYGNVKIHSHHSHDSRENAIIRLFLSPKIISILAILG